jgi:nucleotide-binding universal stress UspA family protein
MERMKILIGYDGSPSANMALNDLTRAGLPRKVEAMVISVSEEWIPAPASIGGVPTSFRADEFDKLQAVTDLAKSAKTVIETLFPDWQVQPEAVVGSPANIILWKADEWKPDLIIVGSHGHTALGRFFFGSVSQKLLHAANCSVRIARDTGKSADEPIRSLVGVDGSEDSEAAVSAIAGRYWPKGSEVRVAGAIAVFPAVASEYLTLEAERWYAAENARINAAVEAASKRLREIGLVVTSVIREANPIHLLCAEAEAMDADCIFVGARGIGRIEKVLLGSVSAAVAGRADCSVEIIRKMR